MTVAMQSSGAPVDAAHANEIRAILDTDPAWAAYAIADLQPSYAPYCRWYVAESAQGQGLALLFTRLTPPALFAIGAADAVAAALESADKPETVYMTLREEHYAPASRYYDFSDDIRPMWRMFLTDPAAVATDVRMPAGTRLASLHAGDSGRIRRLYAHGGPYAPDAFEPYQAEDGVFFGVEDRSGELLAVGGTHVVDWQAGVGAIGNMYTHPKRRGEGLGGALLGAIVDRLVAGGVAGIVLNVDERNVAARRLYERHGFAGYCPYLEGVGSRK
jgi:GNAT superfamily N-acetyltransferase